MNGCMRAWAYRGSVSVRGQRRAPTVAVFFVLAVSLVVSCGGQGADGSDGVSTDERVSTAAPSAHTDDFGMPLPVDASHAQRVVSLNPAVTEIIFAIGADSLLVGRSRWDEYPREVKRVLSVGDGIRPSVETVLSVRPTLVILYASPDNRKAADALVRAGVRTIALKADRIEEIYKLILGVGAALGADTRARIVADSVRTTVERVRALTAALPDRPTVVWPAQESPPIVIGGGSYLDELLTVAGAENVFHNDSMASLSVSIEEIARRRPQLVISGKERTSLLRQSSVWQAVQAVSENRFLVVDVSLMGRPSVVLGMSAVQLARLLHPELADSLR